MFGLSKTFVIVLAFAGLVGWGTHNWYNFLSIIIAYAIIKIVWNLLT